MKAHECIFINQSNPDLPKITLETDKNLYYLIDYSDSSVENDFITYAIDHEFKQAVQDGISKLTEEERALLAHDMIQAKETKNLLPIFCYSNSSSDYDTSNFFSIDPTQYVGKKISHKEKIGDLFNEIYKGSENLPMFSQLEISPLMTYRCKISNYSEQMQLVKLLHQKNLVKDIGLCRVELTLDGYNRFSEEINADSKKVFIAMQFNWERGNQNCDLVNNTHNNNFLNAITRACEYCGFKAEIVSEHHTNNITDQIIKEIRESRFVIADFTFNNRGAYYEAGFARALGKHVIHTVCKGHDTSNEQGPEFKKLHFDIAQINYILWSDFDKLEKDLINRIKALGF